MADLGAIGQVTALPTILTGAAVSGVVLDSSAAPARRTVRAYNRSTGVLIGGTRSDLTTGQYLIYGPLNGGGVELQVICLDDDAGSLENDQILRTYPV